VFSFSPELTVQLHQRIVRFGETNINAGLKELIPSPTSVSPTRSLSQSSSADVLHVVQTTSTAVVFWATAVKSESGLCAVCLCICMCVFVCLCVCVCVCIYRVWGLSFAALYIPFTPHRYTHTCTHIPNTHTHTHTHTRMYGRGEWWELWHCAYSNISTVLSTMSILTHWQLDSIG